MNSQVDLRQLAVRRDGANGAAPRPGAGRRRLLARYLLPGGLLLGFLAVTAWAARDSLLPSHPVTTVPVVVTRSDLQDEGTPLFQAAGWVEPRPTPVVVTALAEGVVERLLVVEGQAVKEGEPLARLIDADARLALDAAESEVRLREAELAGARATRAAAETNYDRPTHLQAALAEAEAGAAKARTDLATLAPQREAALARQEQAELEYATKLSAPNAIAPRSLQQSKSDRDAARAAVDELAKRQARLKEEVEALQNKRDALAERLRLKTDEGRQLGEAREAVKAAEARLQLARVNVQAARLRLGRMTIPAPPAERLRLWAEAVGRVPGWPAGWSGPPWQAVKLLHGALADHCRRHAPCWRVLGLVARPGSRVMGMAPGSLHDASTVVTLYDPGLLQVRADVRLEDVPRVQPGQRARVETLAVKGGPLEGEVLFATSQANVQKNTLEVKVAVRAPPGALKPDMLVQVTFLAPPNQGIPAGATPPERLLVPRQLVENGDGGPRVWVADQAAGKARLKSVKLGPAAGPGLVEVVEGLAPTDKLISGGREGLRDGQRVTVTGEDPALGVPAAGTQRPRQSLPRLAPADGGKGPHH